MRSSDAAQSRHFDFAIELILLAIVYLVPTVFDRTIGIVFSGTKIAVIRLIILFLLSVWALKLLIFREHRFIRTLLDWPVVSYMLACTVATLTSVQVLVSWMGFYGRYEGLSTIYLWGLLFFIVTNFIYTKEQFRRIFITVVSAATLMAVYGIIQRWGQDPYTWGGVVTWQRVISTIGQPNFLAAYMIMAFFFGLGLLIMERHDEGEAEPLPAKVSGQKKGQKKGRSPDLLEVVVNQLIIVGPLLLSLVTFIVMIYFIDTSNIYSLIICWTLITVFALMFAFMSKNIDPHALDALLLICLPLIYTCMLFTQSRGGMFALLASGALFLVLVNRHDLLKNWPELLTLGLVITAITAVTFTNPQYSPLARLAEEVKVEGENGTSAAAVAPERAAPEAPSPATPAEKRKKDIGLELKGAAGSRIETWKSALRIVDDHYLFGIGPEVLKFIFPRYETELFRFKEAFHVKQDRCHNEVCDVSVTKGVVSLFIYLWLLATFYYLGFRKLMRSGDKEFRIYTASMLVAATSYFIQNQFSFGVIAISTLLWVMFGLVAVPELEDEARLSRPPFSWDFLRDIPWIPLAIVIFLLGLGCFFSTRQYMADKFFKDGKNDVQYNQFDRAIANFRRSLAYSPYEGGTVTHLGITQLNVSQGAPDKAAWLNKALETFAYGNVVDPYNADNFYITGKVYISLYPFQGPAALDKALEASKKAIALDPYYAEAYHNVGVVYETQGKLEDAAGQYERAFMIYPDLGIAERQLYIVYKKMGRPERAIEILSGALQRYPGNMFLMENLASAYADLGRNSEAIRLFGDITALDPNNVPAKINLALAKMRAGDLSGAKEALIEAYVKDPTNIAIHNGLGDIYLREGNAAKAIEEFKQVLIVDPSNEVATQRLKMLGVQ